MHNQKAFSLGLAACLVLFSGSFPANAKNLSDSGPAPWSAESDQAGAAFGWSVAGAGDVNGDGFADLLIGAPSFDQSQPDEGRVYAFYGSASGPPASASWAASGGQAGARLGWSIAGAGDVNGDGYSDILVAAPKYSNGQQEEGKVWLYLGSATGLSTLSSWSTEGDQANSAFGFSVSGAGDVNGDGFADVIIGAENASHGQAGEGLAFVYYGSGAGLSATPNWSGESDQSGAAYGASVAGAGDVNGDGYDDVIIGAPSYAASQASSGRAFLYHGSASGLSQSANWTVGGGDLAMTRIQFGDPVNTIGDANGDGYADVIVGASVPVVSTHLLREAFVYYGSPAGLRPTSNWSIFSSFPDELVAVSAGTAGDIDGDHISDLIVGAPVSFKSYFERVRLFLGAPTGLSRDANWIAEGDQAGSAFGASVAAAGDVNGDGRPDVLVGAPDYSNGQAGEGRVFVYSGSDLRAELRPNFFAYLPVLGK